MRARKIAALGFLFSVLAISGDAAAAPVDNPGWFNTWQVSLGAPFIDFPNGFNVTMDQQWTMSIHIPNSSGVITDGTFTYPTLPVNGLPGLTAQVIPYGCQPVWGDVNAGTGAYEIGHTAQIVFTYNNEMCITPPFKYSIQQPAIYPPGAHTITDLYGQGKAQVDQVPKTVTCSGTTAAFINSKLDLGPTNVTYFWFYKAGIETIKGSY